MSINNFMAYFIIYSFFGWIVESLYKTIRTRKLVNSGFLYGLLCPIYGFGALIMLIFLKDFQNNIFILFVSGFIILSIWEYIVSFLIEKCLNAKYWDYSTYKFNINGRVCLLNSFFWGVLSVIFMTLVHPLVHNIINTFSTDQLIYFNIISYSITILDCIFSLIRLYDIKVSIDSFNDITNLIKQNLEKIKQYADKKAKESEKLHHIIEELKQKRDKINERLEKQTERLRKAFPTMQLSKISDIFNPKKDSIKKNK